MMFRLHTLRLVRSADGRLGAELATHEMRYLTRESAVADAEALAARLDGRGEIELVILDGEQAEVLRSVEAPSIPGFLQAVRHG